MAIMYSIYIILNGLLCVFPLVCVMSIMCPCVGLIALPVAVCVELWNFMMSLALFIIPIICWGLIMSPFIPCIAPVIFIPCILGILCMVLITIVIVIGLIGVLLVPEEQKI